LANLGWSPKWTAPLAAGSGATEQAQGCFVLVAGDADWRPDRFYGSRLNLIAGFFVRRFGGLQNRTMRTIDPSLKLSLSYFLAKGDNSRHLSKQPACGNLGDGRSGSTLG
jgi:hypothetical protein